MSWEREAGSASPRSLEESGRSDPEGPEVEGGWRQSTDTPGQGSGLRLHSRVFELCGHISERVTGLHSVTMVPAGSLRKLRKTIRSFSIKSLEKKGMPAAYHRGGACSGGPGQCGQTSC